MRAHLQAAWRVPRAVVFRVAHDMQPEGGDDTCEHRSGTHNMPWLSPADHVRIASHLPKAKGLFSCRTSATLAASLFDAPSYACSTPLPLCLPLIAAS